MNPLEMRDLDEEEFQGMFERCGDMDPLGLVLDGEVIGFVDCRYSPELQARLQQLGVKDVTR